MRRILLIHPGHEFAATLVSAFERIPLGLILCEALDQAHALIAADPPEAVAIQAAMENWGGLRFAHGLRRLTAAAHIPVLMLLPSRAEAEAHGLDWSDPPFDDYLIEPVAPQELIDRLQICISRSQRQLDANPLTRLPGNSAIIREIERRMAAREEFAVLYVDLDNFKAFNDKYGFARGDEALRLTAGLLTNVIGAHTGPAGFVGHLGGDDFVFIVPAAQAQRIAHELIGHFDRAISLLYEESDRRRGAIRAANRRGELEEYPLMSLSIAIVPNTRARLTHLGQVSAIAAELKRRAKAMRGSVVISDRRGPAEIAAEEPT